ncbi:hypothetical protein MKEN_01188700 [Mycena kentingensis (nom. inval.)]|nr:hypothetical protein MKEN_01188700 [Mycena kentingensis (nom. inval.)]
MTLASSSSAAALTHAELIVAVAFAALCTTYAVSSPFFGNPRQAAWILTTIVSLLMTAVSAPYVVAYLQGGVRNLVQRPELDVPLNRGFQAYLLADLIVGCLHYRSQITFLTGWLHHILYLGICEFVIRQRWTHIFALCAVMELPTFLLGLGTLFPRLRSYRLFAFSFFITRIVLHLILLYTYLLPANRPDGSLAPVLLLTAVFPLHALWFTKCVKGMRRRARERRLARKYHTSRWTRIRMRVGRWVSGRRPIRARSIRMARRMSDKLTRALPSKESMMELVGMA